MPIVSLNAQFYNNDSLLVFEFSKPGISLKEPGTFFNVIRIENTSNNLIQGKLSFYIPESWVVIGMSGSDIALSPGESLLLPLRISIPKNTLGGISYLLRAVLRLNGETLTRSSYITIEKKANWSMNIDENRVFISDYRPLGSFNIHLENKGNTNELIRLRFDKGDLLRFQTFIEADSILFVDLPAYSDTLIRIEVGRRRDVGYAETRALQQNWKSTSIYIQADTQEKSEYSGLRVVPLESKVFNDLPLKASPLNLDLTLFNLLSYQRPKASVKLHGKVLFPEKQQVQYSIGMYNLYFTPEMYENMDMYQMLRYMLKYNDPRTQIWIGDRLGTGILHTMTGRGFQAQHTFKDNYNAYLNLIQNPYGPNIGVFTGFGTMIGRVALNTGITLESTDAGNTSYSSVHFGGTYRFLRKHAIRLQTATTLSRFNDDRFRLHDTTTIGFAFRASYHYNSNRLNFRVDNTNTTFTQLKNSGINRINSDLSYKISDRFYLYGLFNHNSYVASRYPYNFFFPQNKNINDNARILFSYLNGNVSYQAGPQFNSAIRTNYNPGSSITSRYENYQPGVMTAVTFRSGSMRSITPSLAVNTMYFNYSTDVLEDESVKISGRWQYIAGLSYYDHAFKLNAYYSSGEASDFYRSAMILKDPVLNQAIHLRPSYERYLNKETIRLSTYMNYAYYMPSQRENTVVNLTGDFYLKSGWNLFSSFNFYRNSRTDSDLGRITTRDLNLLIGFRKNFDIQQPRLKYYDIAIVGFNDQNGNQVKDQNEKPISNVLINIARDPEKNEIKKAGFAETQLITDPEGEIFYSNIPEGKYDLQITPLTNLEDLYFLDGQNQIIEADKDKIHYLPLVESYKIKGRIIVDRDPNSNEGRISLEGVRITASAENGSVYSTLTTSNGNYVLNLPKANIYKVKIFNVYGERFFLEQDEFEIQFMNNKTIQLDFRFTEERRNIRFNGEDQLFDFKIDRE